MQPLLLGVTIIALVILVIVACVLWVIPFGIFMCESHWVVILTCGGLVFAWFMGLSILSED